MSINVVLPGPGDTVRIRASGLGELFDCAARWLAKVIRKMYGPTLGRSHLGSGIHYGTAFYDNERTLPDGVPDTEAAVDKFLEFLRADDGVHWTDIRKKDAESIGIQLVTQYCLEVSPQFQWVKVEIECEPLLLTMPNGVIFELTGHVDRVYTDGNGRFGVADFKSSARLFKADGSLDVAKHGVQLACYELLELLAREAVNQDMTLPALVFGFPTKGESRIQWEPIENPRTLLFGDGETNIGYLIAASKIVEEQLYVGNTKSMLCTPRYCPAYEECFYRRG